MRKFFSTVTTALTIFGGSLIHAQEHPKSPKVTGEFEASSNFDSEDVEPVLLRISKQITHGFSSTDAKTLAKRITKQRLHSEETYTFKIIFEKSPSKLRIVAYMSDTDAPDIWFFTSAGLEKFITQAIDAHMKAAGK